MCKGVTNLVKIEETVKIPVYSSIKMVNGVMIYELDRFEDVPVKLLPNKDADN